MPDPRTSTERVRRLRERRKYGVYVVPVEIDTTDVEMLIRRRFLAGGEGDIRVTRQEIGAAISELLTKLAANP